MKVFLKSAVAAAILFSGVSAHAAQFNVRVVNFTNGIYFTPLLVTAHPAARAFNVPFLPHFVQCYDLGPARRAPVTGASELKQ